MMLKIVTVEQMREIERAADAAGVSYAQMMQNAGRAVAEVAKLLLGDDPTERRIAVLVGSGNNGGDGLVAARILKEELGAQVGAYLLKPRSDDDAEFVAARDAGVFIAVANDDQRWRVLQNLVASADVVIDALLGTGARLPIEGALLDLLKHTTSALRDDLLADPLSWPAMPLPTPTTQPAIIAIDCPSGLNSDTGELDPATIPADFTVTFGAAKKGHLIFPGAGAVGQLVVADIGLPPRLPELERVDLELVTGVDARDMLPKRPRDGHKGTFGRAVIVAGSLNYTGAAVLSGTAAYRAGAGLVTMAVPEAIYPILAAQLPEATWIPLPHEMGVLTSAAVDTFLDEVGEYQALLIGPGLTRKDNTADFLWGLLSENLQANSLIIDADGLNLLATRDQWWTFLPSETVLTPHPGEMSRLSGISTAELAADRFEIARQKAHEWGVVLVLKGAYTIIASPEGRVLVIPFATDALATAGTGDVLAGCIVGLIAQGAAPFEAAVSAAYVHGLAGTLAGQGGIRSVIAGDVLRALPAAFAAIEPPIH